MTTTTSRLADVLTFVTMAGLSFASAAAVATFTPAPFFEEAPVAMLPTVTVVAKRAVVHQLPAVVVVAKSASAQQVAQCPSPSSMC